MIGYAPTEYGFSWGAASVQRLCCDAKKEWVLIGIKTPRKEIQVYVTRTGKVRVHSPIGREWKEEK